MKNKFTYTLVSKKQFLHLAVQLFCATTFIGCDQDSDKLEIEANKSSTLAPKSQGPETPFIDITTAVGISFTHNNGGTGQRYMPEIMGAGGALFDFDNDGDLDLYLIQGADLSAEQANTTPQLSDRLLRNDLELDESGRKKIKFTDITSSSGIPSGGYGMGVATGDIDNDGYIDLYLTNLGPNRLLRNKGNGTFEDITEVSGTGDDRWSVPATFFDMDGDGDLDLYSGTYVDFRISNHKDCFSSTGLPDYCSPHSYSAVTDRLFENQGDGRFTDISAKSGIRNIPSKALGVITGDFNSDGYIDFYVANDGVANQLWINQKNNTFLDEALFAGCAVNYEGSPEASMGVDAADVDGDGDEDLFVTHLRGETNTLYINHGDGTFEDRTIRFGLAGPSIPYTGFGTAWIDVENDGKLDLLAVNGAVTVEENLVQANDPFPYHQPNQLFRNLSTVDELKFEHYPNFKNNPFKESNVSRGALFGDLDNDGDIDVIVTNNSGPARVLENMIGQDQQWLGLEPVVNSQGTPALDAIVTIIADNKETLTRRVRSAGSYVSANDSRLVFGLGGNENSEPISNITVTWPNDTQEVFGPLGTKRYHRLVQGSGRAIREAQ